MSQANTPPYRHYNDSDDINNSDGADNDNNNDARYNADFTASNVSINISGSEGIDEKTLTTFYAADVLHHITMATLEYISEHRQNGVVLPYFADIEQTLWQKKPKALEVYVTDSIEGRALNLEARGKDYATNILSYPSALPTSVIELMPSLALGELIVCHEVLVREAAEQDKTVTQHVSHLIVHGILHLLGFDHELGQAEQDEMEGFEIEILAGLGLPNPYA